MVRVTRRDFLKYCAMSAGALGLSASTLMRLESVLAKTFDPASNASPPVVWIAGAACTGCTMSLINEVFYTTIDNILLDEIDLKFMDTIQATAGSYVNGTQWSGANALQAAQDAFNGPFVLAVEGAIQTATPPGGSEGDYCRIGSLVSPGSPESMYENVKTFANSTNCLAILSIGTCSSFGGIPGAKGNVTGAKGVAFHGTSLGGAIIGNGENGLQDVSVKAQGSGYSTASVVFSGGGGTGASADAVIETGITSISFTTSGVYDLRPDVVFSGGGGTGASAMAVINEWDPIAGCTGSVYCDPSKPTGALLDILVTCSGTGYTSAPAVIVTPVVGDPNPGAGSTTATAAISGYIFDFDNIVTGSGYTSAPAVSVTGDGTGAEAAAVMDFGGDKDSVKYRTGLAKKLINISGCPPHPDWIVGTLAYVLDYLPALLNGDVSSLQLPDLNRDYQPIDFGYATYQCNAGPCPWRYNNTTSTGTTPRTFEALEWNRRYPQGDSKALGVYKYQRSINNGGTFDLGCLGILGCKGRKTKADCSARRWNADGPEQFGVNWCVGSRGSCHGCTSPAFPDKVGKFFTFA
jgi:Ni,Fe-hydrogenase I small subunit